MSKPDFDRIQQAILEDEHNEKQIYNWDKFRKFWQINRKAFSELKSLYETMGPKNFMNTSSKALLKEKLICNPYQLFKLLPTDDLMNEYENAIAEFNREFLATYIKDSDESTHGPIIEYFIKSLNDNISVEFIDSIKLDPESVLFSEEYIKKYGSSLKDNDWRKLDDDIKELTNEANQLAEQSISNDDCFNAQKMYENIVRLDNTNTDALFKMFLCEFSRYRSFDHLIKEYPKIKETNEYKLIKIIQDSTDISFDMNTITNNRNERKTAISEYIKDNNVTDPVILKLLKKIEEKY